jgi:serine/threonine-protein kinase
MIGKTILHYKILEKLGEGGMGIVYKAKDTKLNREVAIKILPPHLLASGDDRARFDREAKAAAALNHPNIATVYEINEHDGKPFIVMEYVEGQTLNHIIDNSPLKLEEAISITVQIAEGLEAAHKKDIVHRDIKSSNILLSSEKKAKILDFGLAKTSMSTKLTQMGTTIGTVAYMSPEQVRGELVDSRTDLWSLGVLLYEMIAGRVPFKAEYDQAIFYSIQNENPDPLTAIRTGVPMSLEWIVNKLMAKDANERYQSAKDLIIDLKAVDLSNSGFSRISSTAAQTANQNSTSVKEKTRFNSKNTLILIAGFITVIISTFLVTLQLSNKPAESLHFNISAFEEENTQILRADMQVIAISPDGNTIAYCVVENLNTVIYIKSLKDFKVTKLDGLGNVTGEPFFSPDGNWLGFNADGKLKRVSTAGGAVDVIYDNPAFRGAAWTSDNSIIYSPSYGSGLITIPVSGGTSKVLTTLDTLRGERTHRWPQLLPDGKHVLFTIGSINSPNSYEDADLAIYSMEDNKKHILSVKGEMGRYVEPGYLVIAKGGKLMAAPFDLANYKVLASPQPVLNDIEGDVGSGISYFGISAKGNIVYLRGTRNQSLQLVWVNNKGYSEPIPLPENPYMLPRISPDGKKIVVNIGTQSASRDIWIYDIETSVFRRLTFGNNGLNPEWSKNSDGIYFLNLKDNIVELTYLSLKNGISTPLQNFSSNTATTIASVSKDDQYLMLNTIGGSNVWKIEYVDLSSKEISIAPSHSDNPNRGYYGGNFSPESNHIAFVSAETGKLEVYITNFPEFELKLQVSNNGGFSPRWSPDGKKLFYVNNSGRLMVLPIKYKPVFMPGKPQELIDVSQMLFPNDNSDNYDVAPDRERFVMIKNTGAQAQLNSFNMIYNWVAELEKTLSSN